MRRESAIGIRPSTLSLWQVDPILLIKSALTYIQSELKESYPFIESWYKKYRETHRDFPPWPARVFGPALAVAKLKLTRFSTLFSKSYFSIVVP